MTVAATTPADKWVTGGSARASNTADSRVGLVAIGSIAIGRTVPFATLEVGIERGIDLGVILSLATSSVNVSLGALHSGGSTLKSVRVAPVARPPVATVLKIVG